MTITKTNGRQHLGIFTLATLPAAPVTDGTRVTVGDVGIPSLELVAYNSTWVAEKPSLLFRQYTSVSCDATTAKNTLALYNIPAGIIGANGLVRIVTAWSCTASTNSKTLEYKLGSEVGFTMSLNSLTTTTFTSEIFLRNRNSVSAQIWSGAKASVNGLGQSPFVTTSQNTGAAKDFTVFGRKAVSGQVLTLEYIEVWKVV